MKVLVTGGGGLVGGHLKEILPDATYVTSENYDLRDPIQVTMMYRNHKPTHVIHAAARVGGIQANIKNPVAFYEDNVLMNTYVLREAYEHRVQRFIGVLSSCAYPDEPSWVWGKAHENYLLREDDMHKGPPAATNFGYGYSKRLLATQIDMYNKEAGTKYNYIVPCNLFGEHDFQAHKLNKLHFVSSIIHKIKTAHENSDGTIEVWGTGKPHRQFMYAGDLAKVLKWMIDDDVTESFNIAVDSMTIEDMVPLILHGCDSSHIRPVWDCNKPDGQFRKDIDDSKFRRLYGDTPDGLTTEKGFDYTPFVEGVRKTWQSLTQKVS